MLRTLNVQLARNFVIVIVENVNAWIMDISSVQAVKKKRYTYFFMKLIHAIIPYIVHHDLPK